jgi:hypothetical protein
MDAADSRAQRMVYQMKWKPTNYHELLMFLVVEMHVATGEHATAEEYWQHTADGLWVATCMGARSGISWSRYRQLRKFFCLVKTLPEDVHSEGPRKGRTISKTHMVDALQKALQRNFVSLSEAGNSFAIDESMVPWYGKYCPIKVYIKGKPYKYGMKIWSCCDAQTGYLRYFKLYTGAGDRWDWETDESMAGWSYAERVVLALSRDLPRGCYFTVDRFFMTPRLAAYMKEVQGKYVTGTMMANRAGLDKAIQFKKSATRARGYYNWSVDDRTGVVQTCWMDRAAVSLCSTAFGAQLKGVHRRTTSGSAERQIEVRGMKAPYMAYAYNATMGGVDQTDFMSLHPRTSWERGNRSRTWWRILFWGLLDRVQTNTFIVFRSRSERVGKRLQHSDFYKELTV